MPRALYSQWPWAFYSQWYQGLPTHNDAKAMKLQQGLSDQNDAKGSLLTMIPRAPYSQWCQGNEVATRALYSQWTSKHQRQGWRCCVDFPRTGSRSSAAAGHCCGGLCVIWIERHYSYKQVGIQGNWCSGSMMQCNFMEVRAVRVFLTNKRERWCSRELALRLNDSLLINHPLLIIVNWQKLGLDCSEEICSTWY